MILKRTGKRQIPSWDNLMQLNVGSAGKGKSQSSIPFTKDIISQFALRNPITQNTNPPHNQNRTTSDGTGSWTQPNTNPYQFPYVPTTPDSTSPFKWQQGYGYPPINQQQKPTEEKPKHDPKEMAGKMVAYATVRVQGIEHTGILFVRRCGAWKLIDCRSMNKSASGSEKSPLPDVTIHYIIYAEETDTKPKPKSRFDDIGMLMDTEIDKDGNPGVKTRI